MPNRSMLITLSKYKYNYLRYLHVISTLYKLYKNKSSLFIFFKHVCVYATVEGPYLNNKHYSFYSNWWYYYGSYFKIRAMNLSRDAKCNYSSKTFTVTILPSQTDIQCEANFRLHYTDRVEVLCFVHKYYWEFCKTEKKKNENKQKNKTWNFVEVLIVVSRAYVHK